MYLTLHRRVQRGGSGGPDPPFILDPPLSSVTPPSTQPDLTDKCDVNCFLIVCLICSLGPHYTDMKGSKYMLVHSLASKYARFVVLGRLMYWTPPPFRPLDPPLLKSDDLFLGNQEILDPPFQKSWTRPCFK